MRTCDVSCAFDLVRERLHLLGPLSTLCPKAVTVQPEGTRSNQGSPSLLSSSVDGATTSQRSDRTPWRRSHGSFARDGEQNSQVVPVNVFHF